MADGQLLLLRTSHWYSVARRCWCGFDTGFLFHVCWCCAGGLVGSTYTESMYLEPCLLTIVHVHVLKNRATCMCVLCSARRCPLLCPVLPLPAPRSALPCPSQSPSLCHTLCPAQLCPTPRFAPGLPTPPPPPRTSPYSYPACSALFHISSQRLSASLCIPCRVLNKLVDTR